MEANREATELRRSARRLREIAIMEPAIYRDLLDIAADMERRADALEKPVEELQNG